MQKNNWTIYATNEDAWLSILHDCARAEHTIDLEQFIFTTEDFGKRLIEVCTERAQKGVKVRFMWDAAGSFTFWGANIIEDLKKRGIELIFWRTLIPSYYKFTDFRSWFLRNHRRTIVIDGKIGYTGSICVQDQMKNWRDINVRLEGPVTIEMQSEFNRMYGRAKNNRPLPAKRFVEDTDFHYVTNYPTPGRRHIYRALRHAVKQARNYIYITTPYFVPTHRLAHVLKRAAERGVDVRIIIPDSSDHYAVDLGARSFFQTMLDSGVRIFLYKGNMIHSKAVVIDDHWASVGTMNLDQISLLYNFEANIVTSNLGFCEEIAAHFVHDMNDCREVDKKEWENRFFLEKFPEYLIRLVRRFL